MKAAVHLLYLALSSKSLLNSINLNNPEFVVFLIKLNKALQPHLKYNIGLGIFGALSSKGSIMTTKPCKYVETRVAK